MSEYDFQKMKGSLAQIAEAMERLSPPPNEHPDFKNNHAFVWSLSPDQLKPVRKVSKIKLELLVGIDRGAGYFARKYSSIFKRFISQ